MQFDLSEYADELECVREVLSDEQINALVSVMQKTFVQSFFGYDTSATETINTNTTIDFKDEQQKAS